MKILFYEVRHSSPNFHEFTGSRIIFAKKKIAFFNPKIGEFFFVKIHFRLLYVRLNKNKTNKKNSGMDHQAIGVGRVKP